MHIQTLFAAGLLGTALTAGLAAPAAAGSFDPYYEPSAPHYSSDGAYREYVPVYSPRRSSCRRALAAVRYHGFGAIRTVECRGRNYTFYGLRDGRWWKVKVRARNGRIRRVYPL